MKYPIGIQTFSEIIEGGWTYVDKTDLIFQLINKGKFYFLSRPRRFGKSLLLSTLDAYFSGRKELFEGLAISKLEKDWIEYPVIRIDLNNGDYGIDDGLKDRLNSILYEYEAKYGKMPCTDSISNRFEWIIKEAKRQTGRNVVVLVDEYEKPLLENIDNEKRLEKFRTELRSFYGTMKTCDADLRFVMLTGVTKMSHTSVFSGLNNLNNITMVPKFATICGFTEEEVLSTFNTGITALAEKRGKTFEETVDMLREEYDGYRFTERDIKVYNPFSLIKALWELRIANFWYTTGTPLYLIHLLKSNNIDLWHIDDVKCKASSIENIDSFTTDPIPVFMQSGYLTIKDCSADGRIFTLGFPNNEVRESFMDNLLPQYTAPMANYSFCPWELVDKIREGNVDSFIEALQALFASIPYVEAADFHYEAEFRNVMYIVLTMMGFYVECEKHVSKGRVDLVMRTNDCVYVMEFKLDGNKDQAASQINEKGYAIPFQADGRQVRRIAVNFSREARNIESWSEV